MEKATLRVTGMHCPSCTMLVGMDLEELDGVASARVSGDTAEVEYDPAVVSVERLVAAVTASGYGAEATSERSGK